MKKINYIGYTLALLLLAGACDQEVIDLEDPEPNTTNVNTAPNCEGATAGTANFSKFIAIGNSFVAGVQGGALFTDGQNNSLPAIINNQLTCVGASATFKQPTIGASKGYNLFVTQPILTDNTKPVLGRLLLQYGTTPDCATGTVSPKPTPQAYSPGELEALPNPTANPGFIYAGTKAELNNFGVPAIVLGQSLITQTGAWSGAGVDPRFNPFYGRLAFPGGASTLIGDAAGAGGTFFLFWLGMDDFFLHAAYGGDPAKAPLTTKENFEAQYRIALTSLLGSNDALEGVAGNFPSIFVMPHFTAVSYNPVPLDAATSTAINAAFAGYNAALDGLIANAAAFGISDDLKAQIATRKVTYTASCTNKMLLVDEYLTDLGPYFDGLQGVGAINADQRAALVPYEQVRQSAATDIIPLSTGSFLGTLVGGNANYVNGVTIPLADQYVLVPKEIMDIEQARLDYNTAIAKVVGENSAKVALADISASYAALVSAKAAIFNGVAITPNINPPTGIYSEDGVHPNTRGYAFTANIFIDAINAKFGSTIPKVNLAAYKATGLPIAAP